MLGRSRTAMSLVLAVSCWGLHGCSSRGDSESDSPASGTTQEFVEAKVEVDSGAFALSGFHLVDASYTAAITGCKSGWSKSNIDGNGVIEVPNTDSECVFKLVNLSIGSELFTFSSIGDASWKTSGSTFTETGSAGSVLSFKVESTLASPISGAQTIIIKYQGFEQAQGQSVDIAVNAGATISGSEPIDLEIPSGGISLVIDSSDGAGKHSISLRCDSPIADGKCNGVELATIKAKLILDETADGSMDLTTCLAKGNAGSVATVLSNGASENGGLLIANAVPASASVARVAPLYGSTGGFIHNKVILVLASAEDAGKQSCKYYNIEVEKP